MQLPDDVWIHVWRVSTYNVLYNAMQLNSQMLKLVYASFTQVVFKQGIIRQSQLLAMPNLTKLHMHDSIDIMILTRLRSLHIYSNVRCNLFHARLTSLHLESYANIIMPITLTKLVAKEGVCVNLSYYTNLCSLELLGYGSGYEQLQLHRLKITGNCYAVPQLCGMLSLTELHVSFCSELSQLPVSLVKLTLCMYHGKQNFSYLTNLVDLALDTCEVEGIPDTLTRLCAIQTTLTMDLGTFSSLRSLKFYGRRNTAGPALMWTHLTALKDISTDDYEYDGRIFAKFTNLRRLELLESLTRLQLPVGLCKLKLGANYYVDRKIIDLCSSCLLQSLTFVKGEHLLDITSLTNLTKLHHGDEQWNYTTMTRLRKLKLDSMNRRICLPLYCSLVVAGVYMTSRREYGYLVVMGNTHKTGNSKSKEQSTKLRYDDYRVLNTPTMGYCESNISMIGR